LELPIDVLHLIFGIFHLIVGSKFQTERVDVRQVSMLLSVVNVVDTVRDIGVTVDGIVDG